MRERLLHRQPDLPESTIANLTHVAAYVAVSRSIDEWMRQNAPRKVAVVIAESTGRVEAGLKAIHAGFSTDFMDDYWHDEERKRDGDVERHFRTTRIVDTIHFASKDESALLQIADTCAFLVKRCLMKRADSAPLFELLSPVLYPRPRRSGTVAQILTRRPLRMIFREDGLAPAPTIPS